MRSFMSHRRIIQPIAMSAKPASECQGLFFSRFSVPLM